MAWHIIEIDSHSFAVSDLLTNYLPAYTPCVHGVTLRQWHTHNLGEDNTEEYNLSFSVALDDNDVRESRMFAVRTLGFEPSQLVFPAQVHGADVKAVDAKDGTCGALSSDTAIPDCDALVTDTPGLLLGITIADCLPVFFFDPIHKAIGIAHSGWRGTAGRIANRTLALMTASFGTDPAACLVAIGPGIGPEGYEVDEKVYAGFQAEDTAASGVFTPTRPGHWQLDLYAAVSNQLMQAGVLPAHIDISSYRTHQHTDLFFSHRLVPGCGRMGAFIGMAKKEMSGL